MNYPHVKFSYNLEKDIENIEIGLKMTEQGRKPDNELKNIINQFGNNPAKKNIKKYLESKWIERKNLIEIEVEQLQKYWNTIEEKFFLHLTSRMQINSFDNTENLSGFFSTRYGSGYNSEKNWFAVSVHQGTFQNTKVAMHEIMHIFFHKNWWKFCEEQGLSEKNIWDVKESVTVLLNLWFKNQLIDLDFGYEEHTELRHNIKKWFLESRDFKDTLIQACDYVKQNPEKSPSWIL